MTVTQRIERFRSRHPITVVETEDPYIGRVYRCALKGLRVFAHGSDFNPADWPGMGALRAELDG